MLKPGSKYYHLVSAVRKLKPGEAMIASKGHDFSCEPSSFRSIVYRAATTKGSGWRGTVVVIGEEVVFAFYKEDDYMRPNLPAYPLVKKLRD
jgi:hypothetical protein